MHIPELLDGTGAGFVRGWVTAVDAEEKTVRIDDERVLRYDTLVYALGGVADTVAVPGADDHAHTLDSPEDAAVLADRLTRLDGGTVVVVGSGLTGVEVAAEIAERHPERNGRDGRHGMAHPRRPSTRALPRSSPRVVRMTIDTGTTGLLFESLRTDALTGPDQLRELYPQPNPNALRKETDRLTEETRALIGCSSLVFIGSADVEGRADVTPRGGPAGFVSVLDERTLAIPDATGNKRLDTLHNVLRTGRVGLLFLVPGRPTTLRVNGRACVSARPELLARLTPVGRPPVTAIVVQVEQVYPHCPKSLMRADAWKPEQWVPADAQPTSAEVTLAQLNLPGLTVDQIEEAERESLRLRYE